MWRLREGHKEKYLKDSRDRKNMCVSTCEKGEQLDIGPTERYIIFLCFLCVKREREREKEGGGGERK